MGAHAGLFALQAIQKGSVDSCREAHQDWLAKVQATLAAPAHVLGPTLSTLAPLQEPHPSRHASFSDTAQVSKVGVKLVLAKWVSSWCQQSWCQHSGTDFVSLTKHCRL